MFTIHNQNNNNLDMLRNIIAPGVAGKDLEIGTYYHLQSPFVLQFTTYHPNNEEQHLLFTSMSPDNIIYSSSSASEVAQSLSGRLHQHDFYELLFVVDGTLYQNIENRRHLYIPGSGCLLNKNVRHKEEYSTDFRVIFFQFSDYFIKDIFSALSMNYFQAEREHKQTQMERFLQQNITNSGHTGKNYIDFIPTKDAEWTIQNVHSIFEQITKELLSPQFGSSASVTALFFKLFHLLDQPEYYQTIPVKIGTDAENRLFREITLLMEKSDGRIPRHELEVRLHYSGDYLNKIVKKYTGLAIYDYGMTFCMKKASFFLRHTDMTINEIALKLGFTNRTHFYKTFQKAFACTPSEYRKTYRADR